MTRGENPSPLIKKVMKSEKGIVLVFDGDGEPIPRYQGWYEEVGEQILRDAPLDAVFSHVSESINVVPREEW